MKTLVTIIVILSVGLFITVKSWLNQREIIQKQETTISSLQTELEKRNNDVLEVSKRNKELEEASKKDKSSMDWNTDISNSTVIKQLQSQCVSCN